jgi:hypothetical protein
VDWHTAKDETDVKKVHSAIAPLKVKASGVITLVVDRTAAPTVA